MVFCYIAYVSLPTSTIFLEFNYDVLKKEFNNKVLFCKLIVGTFVSNSNLQVFFLPNG